MFSVRLNIRLDVVGVRVPLANEIRFASRLLVQSLSMMMRMLSFLRLFVAAVLMMMLPVLMSMFIRRRRRGIGAMAHGVVGRGRGRFRR